MCVNGSEEMYPISSSSCEEIVIASIDEVEGDCIDGPSPLLQFVGYSVLLLLLLLNQTSSTIGTTTATAITATAASSSSTRTINTTHSHNRVSA